MKKRPTNAGCEGREGKETHNDSRIAGRWRCDPAQTTVRLQGEEMDLVRERPRLDEVWRPRSEYDGISLDHSSVAGSV